MKILVSLAASAMAQFGGPAADGEKAFDFSAFSDTGFDYDYGYDASAGYYYYDDATGGRPGASDDERYFFTATSTTTTTTPGTTTTVTTTGTSCWKCDAMGFGKCAAEGQMEECRLGDFDCCFVEIRVTEKKLQQLCTGCKDKTACKDNQTENFSGRHDNDEQCRPEMIQQRSHGRHGGTQSVCRQCFKTCVPTEYKGAFCFGSIDQSKDKTLANDHTANALYFSIPFETKKELIKMDTHHTTATPVVHREATSDFPFALGIPTHILVDKVDAYSAVIRNDIETKPSNVFFAHESNGKEVNPANTDNVWEAADMTYWSLLAGDKAWWESDLKALQKRRDDQTGCTFQIPSDTELVYSGCTGNLDTDLAVSPPNTNTI